MNFDPGKIIFCKLTAKRMIIQKVYFRQNDDPMYIELDRVIEKYLCRYWSKVQDRFFDTVAYPEEISLTKPIFNFDKLDKH